MKLEKKMSMAVLSEPGKYIDDFLRISKDVAGSKAIYKGEPVPFLYIPKIYASEDMTSFREALGQLFEIINRSIELYLTESYVSRLFNFDERLDSLIRLPHFYDINVPMGRFDLFYYSPGEFQFCELNTDGTSAMIEQEELARILITSRIMKKFSRQYSFSSFELFESWVDAVSKIYSQFTRNNEAIGKAKDRISVAIIDLLDRSSPVEFEEFAAAFRSKGYDCFIADPREIAIKNGFMAYKGKKIDIVYRRLVTRDLMERYEEIPGFIEGLYEGRTCVIGSIKTQIVHTKRYFEVLHNPLFRKYLTSGQISFIDRHIPLTKKLRFDEIAGDYLDNQQEYIIKPVDYYASKGVYAGSAFSDSDWEDLLISKSREDYIIQKYAPPACIDNIVRNETGEFELKAFRSITGLFVYGQKLAGLYVRAGLTPVISGLHNGYTMGAFSLEKEP